MKNQSLFSNKFETVTGKEVADIISENSFFSMEKVVESETINNILSEVNLFDLKLNTNDISPVHSNDGYFASSAIAKSITLYNLLTSEKIFDISREYLGDKFRLKCHRVYSTDPFIRGAWHTDNKNHGKVNSKVKGLVFMIYLNDTFEGEFQAIKKSHSKTQNYESSNFDEDLIKHFDEKDIVKFKNPAGSIIIFDNRTIHRAKPYYNILWSRKSLFFQIDNEIEDGEKIIINTRFVKNFDMQLNNYLGFGKKNTMPHEPHSSKIINLNFINICKIQFQLLIAIFVRTQFIIRALFTGTIKRKIKKILGIKRKNYNLKIKN